MTFLLERSDILAISSALVAGASCLLSYMTYRRDQGRLDVKIGIWNEIDIRTHKIGTSFIKMSAVNSGRRPIVVDSIGAFPKWQRLKRFLHRYSSKYFEPVGYFFPDPLVIKELVDPNTGKYRVLSEGESIQITLPLTASVLSAVQWSKIHCFYFSDTNGHEHYCNGKTVQKFVQQIQKLTIKNQKENATVFDSQS